MSARCLVGVDVGGTFTDLFVLDLVDGRASIVKVPSTRGDEARGFLNGIGQLSASAQDIATLVHGTTVATNALLERKVARCGIITTRGFRDVLEMRRRDRPQTWGLTGSFVPIVPRELRLEVDERVLADGQVLTPVAIDEVQAAARRLLDAGCESVCVFFVNAYANAANERAAVDAVRAVWPNPHVTASSEVLPEIREFERCSTATLNACLQPVVGRYLQLLETGLREQGFGGDFLIVQSSGGVMSAATAAELPVRTALSGPAAGVIACAHIARASGFDDVITGDVGGTSFDVSLIVGGQAGLAAQTAIDYGLVIRAPMIQIETIGAGGGSIAQVDAGGLLQVGPQSAGSRPGPACYGHGGMQATVTDANVLLGRIDARRPIGGGLLGALDTGLAQQAIERDVARPLGLDVLQAAEAILTVANARMAGAIRIVSIEKGHDPRRFVYMPFGGGGALHVCAMLREVGVEAAIVPRYPGVTSALGCVLADLRHDRVQTLSVPLDDLDERALLGQVDQMAENCARKLASSRAPFERHVETIEFDMLYVGQTHTVSVSADRGALTRAGLAQAFERAYARDFGRVLPGLPIRVINLRYSRVGVRPKFDLQVLAPSAASAAADFGKTASGPERSRQVYHDGRWWEAPVHDRLAMPVGAVVSGPAILEQPDTTIWLEPGFDGRVDRLGNLLVRRSAAGRAHDGRPAGEPPADERPGDGRHADERRGDERL